MKILSKFFPNNSLLLIFPLGASLLLAACSGNGGPGPTALDTAPATPVEVPTITEDTAEAEAGTPPEPTENAEDTPEDTQAAPTAEQEETAEQAPTAAASPTRKPASAYADLEIVTLLPPDAIPAIHNPQFLSAEEADQFYDPQELVMGVSFNGDSRAYSAPFLSNHEIVNDTVGGVKLAVTW